jgi:hypothetical protein
MTYMLLYFVSQWRPFKGFSSSPLQPSTPATAVLSYNLQTRLGDDWDLFNLVHTSTILLFSPVVSSLHHFKKEI